MQPFKCVCGMVRKKKHTLQLKHVSADEAKQIFHVFQIMWAREDT